MTEKVTHLLFDLGGVIIKLRGAPIAPEWFSTAHSHEDIWKIWLTSDAPRLFESGQIGADDFSQRVVHDLNLLTTADEFLAHFTALPERVYDGVHELLVSAKSHYTTACFSNSNVLHWERKLDEMKLDVAFDHHYASHLIGRVKPDPEAFEYVIDQLGVSADHILFFDDNVLNVEAALNAGMQARQVVGACQLHSVMSELNS